MNTGQKRGAEGAENGSMFLKQLDNLFGLGPLPKRHGNDGQSGREEERKRRGVEGKKRTGEERREGGREGDRWRGKVVVEGLTRGGGVVARGWRLESQDLRLSWLDGSQML